MPYIKREYREQLDPIINQFQKNIAEFFIENFTWDEENQIHSSRMLYEANNLAKMDGIFNYIITQIINKNYNNTNYQTLMRGIGTLECAKQEFYRRVVSPYEDEKMKESGDVYE